MFQVLSWKEIRNIRREDGIVVLVIYVDDCISIEDSDHIEAVSLNELYE
jgi:hypothetical protein